MRLGIARECLSDERRVAGAPETVQKLLGMGFEVQVEVGAGAEAGFADADYTAAGATVVDTATLWSESAVVLKVRPPTEAEADRLSPGATLFAFGYPADNGPLLERLAARKVNLIAMDQVPRISRAQKMDALSSMANIAGYKAVILAANEFGRFFTGQITAAGRVAPAKVLIIGAGVAGLAAIAAAKGLGAVVRAFDTRAATKEQVESLGAEFLEIHIEEDGDGQGGYAKEMSPAYIAAEMDLFAAQAAEVDIVITTALIPGRPAPKLWQRRAVEAMRAGSVVVDLAAERGGNCELTVPGERVVHNGVVLLGYTDVTSRLPTTASILYGNNLVHLLSDMGGGAQWRIDLDDAVVRGALVVHDGAITWPPPKVVDPSPQVPAPAPVNGTPAAAAAVAAKVAEPEPQAPAAPPKKRSVASAVGLVLVGLWLYARFAIEAHVGPSTAVFLNHFTVFVLACFVGWQVVWSVSAALHTPLMSVTNAISGIILVGGMLQLRADTPPLAMGLAAVAVLLATINVAGGFWVTQRMLKMFRSEGPSSGKRGGHGGHGRVGG